MNLNNSVNTSKTDNSWWLTLVPGFGRGAMRLVRVDSEALDVVESALALSTSAFSLTWVSSDSASCSDGSSSSATDCGRS